VTCLGAQTYRPTLPTSADRKSGKRERRKRGGKTGKREKKGNPTRIHSLRLKGEEKKKKAQEKKKREERVSWGLPPFLPLSQGEGEGEKEGLTRKRKRGARWIFVFYPLRDPAGKGKKKRRGKRKEKKRAPECRFYPHLPACGARGGEKGKKKKSRKKRKKRKRGVSFPATTSCRPVSLPQRKKKGRGEKVTLGKEKKKAAERLSLYPANLS